MERDVSQLDAVMSPGIHHGIPFDEYRALPGINISTLRWADYSAAHLKAALDGKLKHDSADMEFGRALHCRLLEPEEYPKRFAVAGQCAAVLKSGPRRRDRCGNDGRNRFNGLWYCGVHAVGVSDLDGMEILTGDQAGRIEMSAEFIKASPVVRLLRQRGGCEATAIFEVEGIAAKGRIDKYIPRNEQLPPVIVDLKKVQVGGATTEEIERAIYKYQYDAKAAWYLDAVKALTGDEPLFIWIFVEQNYPFCVRALQASFDTLAVGRIRYRTYLGTYLRGLQTGEWPGYQEDTRIPVGGLSGWAIAKFLGR